MAVVVLVVRGCAGVAAVVVFLLVGCSYADAVAV